MQMFILVINLFDKSFRFDSRMSHSGELTSSWYQTHFILFISLNFMYNFSDLGLIGIVAYN